jgi:methionyl-tRNA formyltransferase
LRIIFLGTPEFSVTSLDAMIKAGFNVVAVVTAPDKPAGRGMKITSSAVKQYAENNQIPVLQPVKLKDADFLKTLKSYKADLQVVIAFRMLPEVVWNMPSLGTVNLHASLLPDYRGAAPINWAIMNGETETGVSTFFLKQEIDTGDLIFTESTPITADMNAGTLHDILKELGAKVMLKTLHAIQTNNYNPVPQDNTSTKVAPKIFSIDCVIDWTQKSVDIYNKIRGLSPHPGASCQLEGKNIKIYTADYIIEKQELIPGQVITDNKSFIKYSTFDGIVNIIEIQLEGKKRMFVEEFLRGNKLHFNIH